MAFEYGEQRDASGNIIRLGAWGVGSSPKDAIPKMIENFRALKEDGIVTPDNDQIDHAKIKNIGKNTHTDIDAHIANSNNPHSTTAEQTGAYTKVQTDTNIANSLTTAKTYTDTKVANLVNSAPATLDTLKELADALGDDPNFATTITNLIGTKAPLSHNQAWSTITSTPTTLAGYKITDGVTQTSLTSTLASYATLESPVFTGKAGAGNLYVLGSKNDTIPNMNCNYHGIGYNPANNHVLLAGFEGVDVITDSISSFKWNGKQLAVTDSPVFVNRIMGDFTSTTTRTMFQTSITDGNTILQTIPNGAGSAASMIFHNTSNIADTSRVSFGISSANAFINSMVNNSGGTTHATLPISFQINSVEKMGIAVDGTVTLSSATENNAITITNPTYVAGQPVKLLNFNWYGQTWSFGNIRGESTNSYGLGVYKNGVGKAGFNDNGFVVNGDGAITIGPNSTYGAYLVVGGNSNNNTQNPTVCTSNGNLHLDSSLSHDAYINYFSGGKVNFGKGIKSFVDENGVFNGTATYAATAGAIANGATAGDITSSGWYRNVGQTGLYSQTFGSHIFAISSDYWRLTSDKGMQFTSRDSNTIKGYIYGDTSSNFGLLNNTGGWSVRVNSSEVELYGTAKANGGTIISSANIASYNAGSSSRTLQTGEPSSTDSNTIFTGTPAGRRGFTEINASPNAPNANWWFLDNLRHSNAGGYWGIQYAHGWEENKNRLLMRNVSNGSFGGWVEFITSANIGSQQVNYSTYTGGIHRIDDGSNYSVKTSWTGTHWLLQGYQPDSNTFHAPCRVSYADYAQNAANNFLPTTDNAYILGGGSNRWSQIYCVNPTINTSDVNAKTDIKDTSLGLDFINKLRPVEFKYKVRQNQVDKVEDGVNIITITPEEKDEEGNVIKEAVTEEQVKYKEVITPLPGVRTHVGLIAQEVKEILDALGIDYAIFTKDEETELCGLRYEELVAPLIKSVQELSAKVNYLQIKLDSFSK